MWHRAPVDDLYTALRHTPDGTLADLPFTLTRIGDCEAPGIIAAATYAGHRYAQNLDRAVDPDLPLRHDKIDAGDGATSASPDLSAAFRAG